MSESAFTPPIHTIPKNSTEQIYFVLDNYKNIDLASVRVWYGPAGGNAADMKPTNKGLSVRVEQLPDVIEGFRILAEEAVKRGQLTYDEENGTFYDPKAPIASAEAV